VLSALAAQGIAGGLDLGASYPELGPSFLVCATETKTDADIDSYARALGTAMHAPQATTQDEARGAGGAADA
jgi:glycine dehydrogenase subunit 1